MIYKYIYRTCPFPLVRMNYFNGIISIIKIGKELKGKKNGQQHAMGGLENHCR
jgi:hypothetical protein